MHLLYVGIQLLVDDCGYLVYDADVINACYLNWDSKVQLFMGVPVCSQNPVAMAALERVGDRAVALVDYNMLLLVVIAQDIISGYRVAAIGNYVSALDILVGKAYCFLGVNLAVCLCIFLISLVVLLLLYFLLLN